MTDNKFSHNADNVFRMTKEQAGKNPKVVISDKLPAYQKSAREIFGNSTYHLSEAGIRSKRTNKFGNKSNFIFHPSNNKMERFNGEIRDREQAFRGLKKLDTNLMLGMKVYYNFTKKHSALGDRTPAESSFIEIDGMNKWKTIIQYASLEQTSD